MARGFWSRNQDEYPNAFSTASLALRLLINTCHKDAKKQEYSHQAKDNEHGVFTPLVFTSTGDMGCEVTVLCRCLADLLVTHWGQEYNQTINWLRCFLSFTLLHCAIMHIRGSRSFIHHPVLGPLDLSYIVLAESQFNH